MLVSEAYARNLIFRWLLLPQWNNFPSNTITTATTIRPWKCVSIQLPGWWGSWIPFFLSFKDWLQIKAYFYFCFLKTGETAVPTRNRNLIHLKKKKKKAYKENRILKPSHSSSLVLRTLKKSGWLSNILKSSQLCTLSHISMLPIFFTFSRLKT